MHSIRVSLVDDQPIVLAGLRAAFSNRDDFEVVSAGKSAQDLVDIAHRVSTDVILVDISVPGRVIEALAKVSETNTSAKVVVYTGLKDVNLAIKALEAGAKGYILKSSSLDEVANALKQVVDGETYITATFAMKVASSIQRDHNKPDRRVVFSRREEEVLRHLLRGQTNKEIASVLDISEKTVKQYMTIIIQKLNVRNRVEVVLAAQELLKSPTPAHSSHYS